MQAADQFLYEVADAVSDRDRITGARTLNLADRQKQITEADALAEQIIAQYQAQGKPLNEQVDADSYARLTKIFDRVHAVSHFADEKWTVVLTPSPEFNAYVLGGTFVFVHRGLLAEASDDEVAALLGHELGHVAANHTFERKTHLIAAQLAGSNSVQKPGYVESYTIAGEGEADRIGVLYAALAGFDPHAASRLWARLASQPRNNPWAYFRKHPLEMSRAQQTRQVAKEVEQYYAPFRVHPDAKALLNCNSLWCNSETVELAAGSGGGLFALLEMAADGYLKHLQAKAERERQENQIARWGGPGALQAARGLPPGERLTSGSVHGPVNQMTYRGRITSASGVSPAAVRFGMTRAGHLVGSYDVSSPRGITRGELMAVETRSDGGILFEWRIGERRGGLLAQFSENGRSFDGVWWTAGANAIEGRFSGAM
jgi:hypothetical protein